MRETQLKLLGFLRARERRGSRFTLAQAAAASGLALSSVRTYVSKKLTPRWVESEDSKYYVVHGALRMSDTEFARVLSQKADDTFTTASQWRDQLKRLLEAGIARGYAVPERTSELLRHGTSVPAKHRRGGREAGPDGWTEATVETTPVEQGPAVSHREPDPDSLEIDLKLAEEDADDGHADRDEQVEIPERWLVVVLRRMAGPTDARWACVCQLRTVPPDEAEVRCWFYALFDEADGPWVRCEDGAASATTIDVYFPTDEFHGMPPYYTFEKTAVTRPGSRWRMMAPGGREQGFFSVEMLREVSRSELEQLEALLKCSTDASVLHTIAAGSDVREWSASPPRATSA